MLGYLVVCTLAIYFHTSQQAYIFLAKSRVKGIFIIPEGQFVAQPAGQSAIRTRKHINYPLLFRRLMAAGTNEFLNLLVLHHGRLFLVLHVGIGLI